MRIYLAAPWKRKDEAKEVRDILVANGHEVTSRWLDFPESPDGQYSVETLKTEAQNDIQDIVRAHVLVVLNLQYSEGKATEQGIALVLGKPIVVVDDNTGPNNVFHNLGEPRVYRVPALSEALRVLKMLDATYPVTVASIVSEVFPA